MSVARLSLQFLLARAWLGRVEMTGDADALRPAGPAVFLVQHVNGLVDGLVMRRVLPADADGLVAAQWHRHAPLRWLVGGIPVVRAQERERHAMTDDGNDAAIAAAVAHVLSGHSLVLFPEGTSSDDGQLQPLRHGAARMVSLLAMRGVAVPCVPVVIRYDNRAAFRPAVRVHAGAPFTFADAGDVAAVTHTMFAALATLAAEADAMPPPRASASRRVLLTLAVAPLALAGWLAGRRAPRDTARATFRLLGGFFAALLLLLGAALACLRGVS